MRIPVKRRPSTRKARQELIRNSGTDFKLNLSPEHESQRNIPEDDTSSPVIQKQTTQPKKQKSIDEDLNKPISDDLFADIGNTLPPESTEVTEKVVPRRDLSLFSSSGSSDSSLFTDIISKDKIEDKHENVGSNITEVQKVNSKQKENIIISSENLKSNYRKKSDLFDDAESGDDDDDDIFSTKKLPPKSNILKKSLFDDEFDDDDIFGPSTSTEAAGLTKGTGSEFLKDTNLNEYVFLFIVEPKSSEKKPVKATHIKKLKNTEVEDDPLSAFNDN